MLTEADDTALSVALNNPGFFLSVCVELEIDALAVSTLLQSHHINDLEGAAGSVAFDTLPQANLEDMLAGHSGEENST